MASSLRRRSVIDAIPSLDPGKVWRDTGSSGPAPSLTDNRVARQSLADLADIWPDRGWFQVPAASRVRHPIEPAVEGGDVEDVEVRAAEDAVRRTASAGKQVLLQHRAIGGKDRDARTRPTPLPTTGGHDVAVRGPAHAVYTARLPEVVEHSEVGEGPIGRDRVGAELADRSRVVVALRHEKR